MRILLLLGICLQAAQDDPAELIHGLRSDRAEERDDAAKKLTELGTAAVPALEALRRDPDEEVARRASGILRDITRREEVRALRTAGRLRSADIKNLTLVQAAVEVFGGFGVEVKIDPFGIDLGITAVTLQFKDAGFWEAVDLYCAAGGVRVEPSRVVSVGWSPLTVSRPLPWPVHYDTIGDVRVYANLVMSGAVGETRGDLTARVNVVFPPWAVPDQARIEGVKIAGQSVEENDSYRAFRSNVKGLPRKAQSLTVAQLWGGGDWIKRSSLTGARTIKVEGSLVMTRVDPKGIAEVRLPFSIPEMAVPPAPAR